MHWLCEQKGICKARVNTKGKEVVKRTNEHTQAPNEQDVSCRETKAGIKRRARESQDSSHYIVSESDMISEGTAIKLPKLDSLSERYSVSVLTCLRFRCNLPRWIN